MDGDSFTWSNKEFGRRRIACELGRILVNHEIVTLFSEARVITGTIMDSLTMPQALFS